MSTEQAEGADAHSFRDLLADSRALLPEMIEIRRRLHRHPEIGLHLPQTQTIAARELSRLGLRPLLGRSVTSITAEIEGRSSGPTLILRADMDALPLQEDTGLDFASDIPDAMHACGHDLHVAMLLGAARLLLRRTDLLAGRVLLVFQPGEEGFDGARAMLNEGLLNTVEPHSGNAAFALHIFTRYASGTISLRAGAMLAASDTIRITIHGRGGHASAPHLAVDPTLVAAHVVLAVETIVARQIDIFDPAVVTIANVVAGTTPSVIPDTAHLQGTMRTISEESRGAVKSHIRRVVEGICAAHGATFDLEIEPGYPVTVNSKAFSDIVHASVSGLIGANAVRTLDFPIMAAEDFSYLLQQVPGAIAFLGGRPAGLDAVDSPMNHSNLVVFDEPAMAVGAATYAAVALSYLNQA